MKEILEMLIENKQVSLDKLMEFIKFTCETDKPGIKFNPQLVSQMISAGMLNTIIQHQYNKILKDPKKYGLSITTVHDKTGAVIKTIIKERN